MNALAQAIAFHFPAISTTFAPRLLRVRPGSDQPSVLDAIRHAGGSRDGLRRFFWVDAFKLRQLEAELRANADLFR